MLQVIRIARHFPDACLSRPGTALRERLEASHLSRVDLRDKQIAVPIGSRGIHELVTLVRTLTDYLLARGARPFVVPAMGSHGGMTAEGQSYILASLGLTEASLGVPIRSSMDTQCLGTVEADGIEWPVHIDRIAAEADGIVLFNRIKPHTDFTADYESGLMKSLVVGLGNDAAASVAHSRGTLGLRCAIPAIGRRLLATGKILGGVALVENAHHHTAALEVLAPEAIETREPELLQLARQLAPDLPVDTLEGLVIERMGKNISGTGIDTNVVGRRAIAGEADPARPRIGLIGVCELTEASGGNALGMGLADMVTARLAGRINPQTTAANALTTGFLERGKCPLVLSDAQALITAMVAHHRRAGIEQPRIAIIRDTLQLERLFVSASLLPELAGRPDITIETPAHPLAFTPEGALDLDYATLP